jgi:hypothetical protein
MFIPDPGSFLPVPDPGIEKHRVPDPEHWKTMIRGGGALSLSGDEGGGSEGSHWEPNADKHGLLPAYSLYGAELSRRVHLSENMSMWRVYILRDNLFDKKSRLIDRREERSQTGPFFKLFRCSNDFITQKVYFSRLMRV